MCLIETLERGFLLLKARWQNGYWAAASSLCHVGFRKVLWGSTQHRARYVAGAQEMCTLEYRDLLRPKPWELL